MSVLEIWGAEYQENDCLLIKPESRDLLQAICDRERCFMQVGAVCVCVGRGGAPRQ
jgi:phosphoribosylformylglycinamidine synthase